ncbi:MAG TPA: putative metallopeptidase [Longimicrobium sp.]|nr:putative metallopeptidase [Longimicrobium sp.]
MRTYGQAMLRSPAMEMFVRDEFTSRWGLFWDQEHAHLAGVWIGVVWASSVHKKKGQEKAGMMELLPDPESEPTTWADARNRDWLRKVYAGETFGAGREWPRFQMTLSSVWAWASDDRTFLANVDHEVCHAGVSLDKDGVPRINGRTGEPVWAVRPHDAELFTGTVRRFGAQAAGAAAVVEAASLRPRFEWVPGTPFVTVSCATCGAGR